MRAPTPRDRTLMRLRRLTLPCLAFAGTVGAVAWAATDLPLDGPIPVERYGSVASNIRLTPLRAAAVVETEQAMSPVVSASPSQTGMLDPALDALDAGNVTRARDLRDAMPPGSLDRKIAQWAIATSGKRAVPAAEIREAKAELEGWPGAGVMAVHLERALARELEGAALIRALGADTPYTVDGQLALAEALAPRDPERAARLLRPVWHGEKLDAADEFRILGWGDGLLDAGDHRRRIAYLLAHDRVRAADRLVTRAGRDVAPLVRAAGAVARRKGETRALEAVPNALRGDPIYLHAKARHLMRARSYREAAELLNTASIPEADAGDAAAWWEMRHDLVRRLLDQNDARLAYGVARGHSGGRPRDIIEAEFLAGWIALRRLGDAAAAREHFAAVLATGSRALSVSRGAYWLGRAEEALGNEAEAEAAYRIGADLRTTFYGQLAAEKLDERTLLITYPRPSEADRRSFAENELVQAIERLESSGHASRARRIYRHLARTLPNARQVALLTARAEDREQFQLSLQMGKSALAEGLNAEALAFPTGAIPASAPLSDTGRALAYAIARQESAFDREAKSHAGARGLLQLMPATARQVSGWMKLPYATSKLTSDPSYNAALGARFLSHLLDRFDGSYVLAAVAYNAGPTRATNWRARNGDPVGASVEEIVDWIESIPFDETRNYVQRVMENYQVYRARLEGRPLGIARDLRFGRTS